LALPIRTAAIVATTLLVELFATSRTLSATERPAVAIDVAEITIADVRAALEKGSYSAEQLTQAFLNRIAAYDPYYNSIISLNPNALADARRIDARRGAGESLGPLAGVAVVIKDSIDIAGMATTNGWAVTAAAAGGFDLIPERDAPVVAKLRAADAIILGKANLSALSRSSTSANTSWRGPVFNAVNRDIAPGGSSAGTATAIGASFAVVGLGEETGGSIQNPAGAQSVVAVKPTFALIPNIGMQPSNLELQDVVGPFARTVTDVAILLDAISGYTVEDPKTVASFGNRPARGYAAGLTDKALRGARIGLYGPGWSDRALSPETQKLFDAAVAELRAQGATIVRDPFAGSGFAALRTSGPPNSRAVYFYDWEAYLQRLGPNAVVNTLSEYRALPTVVGLKTAPHLNEAGDLFGPGGLRAPSPDDAAAIAQLENPTIPPDLSANFAYREKYLAAFRSVMKAHNLDAMVFPQAPEEYPGVFAGQRMSQTAAGMNTPNLPGVVVPAGKYASGTPFAIMFVGDLWAEGALLNFAYDYEQATHHRIVPKLVTEPYPVPKEIPPER